MARLNKFTSVNFNDYYGKADQSHVGASSGSKSNSASSTRSRISSHSGGMLILTRPKQPPSSTGRLGIPNPVNLPSLKREGSETLAISPPVTGWSTKGDYSDASNPNSSVNPNPDANSYTNANANSNPKKTGDVVSEQLKPFFKSDVYAPPAVRAIQNASRSTPLITPPLEKQPIISASKVIHEEEFPALRASRPPTPPAPNTKSHIDKNQNQNQNQKKNQDGKEAKHVQPLIPSALFPSPSSSSPPSQTLRLSGSQELANPQENDSNQELEQHKSPSGHQMSNQIVCADEKAEVSSINDHSDESKEVVHNFRPQYRTRVSVTQDYRIEKKIPASLSSLDSVMKGNSEHFKLADDHRSMPPAKGSELSGSFGQGYLSNESSLSWDAGFGADGPQSEGPEYRVGSFGKDIKDSSMLRDVGIRRECPQKDVKDAVFLRDVGSRREGPPIEEPEHRSGSFCKDVKDSSFSRDVGFRRKSPTSDGAEHRSGSLCKDVKDSSFSRDVGFRRKSPTSEGAEHLSGCFGKDIKDSSFSRDVGFRRKSPQSEGPEHRSGSFGKDIKDSSLSRDVGFRRISSPSEGDEHRSGSFGKDVKESLFPRDVGFRRKSPPSEQLEHRSESFGNRSYLDKDSKDAPSSEGPGHRSGSFGKAIKDSSFSRDVGYRREGPPNEWPEHRSGSFGKGSNVNKDFRDDGFGREGPRSEGPEHRSGSFGKESYIHKKSSFSRDVGSGREGTYVEHDGSNKEESSERRSFGLMPAVAQTGLGFYGKKTFSNGIHNDDRREVNDWGIRYTQDKDSASVFRKDRRDVERNTANMHRKDVRDVEEYNAGMHRKDKRDMELYITRDTREIHNKNVVDVYDQNMRNDQVELHSNAPIKDGCRTDSQYNRGGNFHNSRPYSPGQGHDVPYIKRYNSYGSGEYVRSKDGNLGLSSTSRWTLGVESEGPRSSPYSDPSEGLRTRGVSRDSVREYSPRFEKTHKVLEQDQQVKFEDKGREAKPKVSMDEPHGSYSNNNERSFHKREASQRVVPIDVSKKLDDEQSPRIDSRVQVLQEEERRKEAARLKLIELEERIAQRPSENGRQDAELKGVSDNRSHMMNGIPSSGQDNVISIKPFPHELKESLLDSKEKIMISKEEHVFPPVVTESSVYQDRKAVRSHSPPTSSWRKETVSGPKSKLFSSPYIESGRRPTPDGGTYKLF